MNLEAERGRLLQRDAEWASLSFDRGEVERRREV
jgi:hypothetical protein